MPRQRKTDRDGLYRQPRSPYWYGSYVDHEGKRHRRSTGTDNRREAEAVLAGWKVGSREVADGTQPRPLHEAIMLYLESQDRDLSREGYSAAHLYRVLDPGRDLQTLRASDISHYIAVRRRDGVVTSTINRELALLSAAINHVAQRHDWPIRNPVQGNRLSEPPPRGRWLTRVEAAALLRESRRSRQATDLPAVVTLALYAGLRRGEILGLTWDRVDLARRVILLPPAAQKNRRWDTVPLCQQARAVLVERSRWRARHCPASTRVICTQDGRPVDSVKRAFAGAVQRAGLVDVTLHDLRRTCGSWLVQAGTPIKEVSALLRHGDIRITASIYAYLMPGQLAATVAALDAVDLEDSHTGVILGASR